MTSLRKDFLSPYGENIAIKRCDNYSCFNICMCVAVAQDIDDAIGGPVEFKMHSLMSHSNFCEIH